MAVGADLEKFALRQAMADDQAVAGYYSRAGARVADMDAESLKQWQSVARTTAWREFGGRSDSCAKLLALAEKSIASL